MDKIIVGITLFVPASLGIFMFTLMYALNIVKFAQCDFKAGYECEVVHAVGVLVPPASLITVWVDTDGEE
jgi:hypothetical protein